MQKGRLIDLFETLIFRKCSARSAIQVKIFFLNVLKYKSIMNLYFLEKSIYSLVD